jgi:glutaredoxin
MTKLSVCLVAVMLLGSIHVATGALYRWVDENGVVHFDETRPGNGQSAVKVDSGPEDPRHDQELEGLETRSGRSDQGPETNPGGEDEVRENPIPEVELYVTSWCMYCKMAADFLRSKGVPFTSYNIEKDKEAAIRKMRLDPSPGVPFAVINGFRIHGFSVEGYEKALSFNAQEEESK